MARLGPEGLRGRAGRRGANASSASCMRRADREVRRRRAERERKDRGEVALVSAFSRCARDRRAARVEPVSRGSATRRQARPFSPQRLTRLRCAGSMAVGGGCVIYSDDFPNMRSRQFGLQRAPHRGRGKDGMRAGGRTVARGASDPFADRRWRGVCRPAVIAGCGGRREAAPGRRLDCVAAGTVRPAGWPMSCPRPADGVARRVPYARCFSFGLRSLHHLKREWSWRSRSDALVENGDRRRTRDRPRPRPPTAVAWRSFTSRPSLRPR